MKEFFDSLFGKKPSPTPEQDRRVEQLGQLPKCSRSAVKRMEGEAPRKAPTPANTTEYREGDVIAGKYEIHQVLGQGGFGVVYLALNLDTQEACALKTFRKELLADRSAREAFKKEALMWVSLGEHPFILPAFWIQEVFGRLFVAMDFVPADPEGRVSLQDHLDQSQGPLEWSQALKWGIQFCIGMEHARAHGIECHRDIKPGNILIKKDRTLLISDFGLAVGIEKGLRGVADGHGTLVIGGQKRVGGISLAQENGRVRCGTPGYISPEVFRFEGADVRSDIYSFGLVLWQIASGTRTPPFMAPWRGNIEQFLCAIYEQQMTQRVPPAVGLLGPVIEGCLQPKPADRYTNFTELRRVLEPLFQRQTGQKFEIPQQGKESTGLWVNRGSSLAALGKREEAIVCFERALAIDAQSAAAWNNKGNSLDGLGRREEAIVCYDKALELNPGLTAPWMNKGACLGDLGRREEAIGCYDRALTLNPRNAALWCNKGVSLNELGRSNEAMACLDEALAVDARDADAWFHKAGVLSVLGDVPQAIQCYDTALAIDPLAADAWFHKGNALIQAGRLEDGLGCYNRALENRPGNPAVLVAKGDVLKKIGQNQAALQCYDKALIADPKGVAIWNNKANALRALGREQEALHCYDQALAINPQGAMLWLNKGYLAADLGRAAEAMRCYDQALTIDPGIAPAWLNKGSSLLAAGRYADAVTCYKKALAIDPSVEEGWCLKGIAEDVLKRSHDALVSYQRFVALAPPEHQHRPYAEKRLRDLAPSGT